MALIPVFLDRQDAALLREAAAHFLSLVTDKNGLLPCPFCGDPQPSLMRDLFVLCECGGKGPLADSQADAIAAWNRRGGVAYGI